MNFKFFHKISYTILLFVSKYEFRIISAFIWYAYCLCWWKIIIFQNFVCQKFKNPCVKLGHFGVTLQKNYGSYEVAQSFYRCKKIPSFIWDYVWTDLGKDLGPRSSKSLSGRFHPPPLYRSTWEPTLIRVFTNYTIKFHNPIYACYLVLTVYEIQRKPNATKGSWHSFNPY